MNVRSFTPRLCRRAAVVAMPLLIGLFTLSACGSDSGSSQAARSNDQTSTSSGIVAQAGADLAAGYAGTDRLLPSTGPTPQKGKKVVVVACGLAAEGCATGAKAMQEAGGLIGWDMSIVDGKFDPSKFTSAVRQAIAEKADGIILAGVDCAPVKSAVAEARAAGIAVLGVASLDCDDPSQGGGTPEFSGVLGFGKYTLASWSRDVVGKAIADYIIAKTDGHAMVIEMHEDDVAGLRYLAQGFEARMNECSTCTVWRVAFSGADLANGNLQSKAAAALVAHPDANAVVSPYDAAVLAGIGPAVQATGRHIILTGNEGLTPSIAEIRAGGPLTMVPGTPLRWVGWAAVDEMNRLLDHMPLVDEGLGLQLVDQEHPLPARYTFYDGNPKTDYVSAYKRLWGLP
jgi:ribose transport system substrate-binding protein